MTDVMLTDAVLVDRVVAGFEGDFEELYRRHSQAAWRLAQAVTGNGHDASDAVAEAFARVFQAVKAGRLTDASAFRSYLLTATRNAAMDTFRRGGKARPTADDDLDGVDLTATAPADAVDGSTDAAMISEAFRNLPERWRSVLWLTEVEGVATKDVADQLGISPNGVAQLAVRARAGLRERFLQAHLRGTTDPDCRFTVDRLGAYVGGGLSPRDLAKVDQHLAGCEPCREKKEELEDLGSSLRRIVLPIPLVLAAVAGTRVQTALAAAFTPVATAPSFGSKVAALAQNPPARMQRLVAAGAAGVLGVGLFAATFSGGTRPAFSDLAAPAGADEVAMAEVDLPTGTDISFDRVPAFHYRTAARPTAPGPVPAPIASHATPPVVSTPAVARPTAPPAAPPAATKPETDTPGEATDDAAEPVVAVTAGGTYSGDSIGVSFSVGPEPDAGLVVGDTVVGTEPDVPAEDGIAITVDPIGADPIEVGLP